MKIGQIWRRPATALLSQSPPLPPASLRPISPLPPPPPSILSARLQAILNHRTGIRLTPESDHVRIGQKLQELPPISAQGGALALRSMAKDKLEQELGCWRRTCVDVHAMLSENQNPSLRRVFENSIVRVVAHTMRLLMILGHFAAAHELDRAFYTTLPPPSRTLHEGNLAPNEYYHYGEGLGLNRGGIQLAWMQSLALRSAGGDYADLAEFGKLVRALKESKREEGLSPYMTAFLIRTVGALAERAREGGQGETNTFSHQLDVFLLGLQADHRLRREGVVQLAIVDMEILTIERELELNGGESPQTASRMNHLEGKMQNLLSELDGESTTFNPREGDTPTPSPSRPSQIVDRRAHILHLTIRFLLLRERISSTPSTRYFVSATALYQTFFSELHSLSDSPDLLDIVRVRQTASLIRILNEALRPLSWPQVHAGSPTPNFSNIELAISVIQATLSSHSKLPQPLKSYIVEELWHTLFFVLTLPSAPTRTTPPHPPAFRPPWPILRSALECLRDCKIHDGLPRQPISEGNGTLRSKSLLFHILRATLLGGTEAQGDGEGSTASRLETLVRIFEELDRSGDPVKKSTVAAVFDDIALEQWPGWGFRAWRRSLRDIMKKWAKEAWYAGVGGEVDKKEP